MSPSPPPRRRRDAVLPRLIGVAVGCAVSATTPAHAECTRSPHTSCLDAETFWFSAPVGRFVSIPSGRVVPAGDWALAGAVSGLVDPIVLTAPSPDPDGRELEVVSDTWTLTLAAAYGLPFGFELSAAIPIVPWQAGSGLSGITTRSDASLQTVTLRDPRAGLAYGVWSTEGNVTLDVKADFTVSIPLGDSQSFASNPGFVWAPRLFAVARTGRLLAALDIGARLRQSAALGDTRMGSQLVLGTGLGVALLDEQMLDVLVEGRALPVLVSQDIDLPDGSRSSGTLAPAEAWLGARSAPWGPTQAVLQIAAGIGLPLSAVTRTAPDGSTTQEIRAAPTTPAFRAVATIGWTIGDEPSTP